MLQTLAFVWPVLFPSWRFFKTIEASPRVEWAVVPADGSSATDWQPFRPPPQHVPFGQMVLRLLWNPRRNEDLFIVSCAERIGQQPTAHSIEFITQCLQRDLGDAHKNDHLQFRLVFVRREGEQLTQDVVFQSVAFPAAPPC